MKFSIFRNIVFGLLIGAATLGVGSRFLLNVDAEDAVPEPELASIQLLTFEALNEMTSDLTAFGKVEAVQDSPLVFQINGKVDQLYVKAGDFVQKGQALARIQNEGLAAQVKQAQASYEAVYNSYLSVKSGASDYSVAGARSNMLIAEKTLEDLKTKRDALEAMGEDSSELDLQIFIQEEILDQNYYNYQMLVDGAKESDLAAQEALVKQAAAGLESVMASYDELTLRAPFAGEVSSFSLQVGDLVAPGQSVGVLVNRDNIEVITYLSGKDARTISVHNPVWVNGEILGEVIGVSSRVDEFTKKRKVRIHLNSLGSLIVGETIEIQIEQDKAPLVTLLPLSALVFDDEANYVLAYEDGVLHQVEVKTGDLKGDLIEVIEMPKLNIAADVSGLRDAEAVNLIQ